jgi:hypothetical protein
LFSNPVSPEKSNLVQFRHHPLFHTQLYVSPESKTDKYTYDKNLFLSTIVTGMFFNIPSHASHAFFAAFSSLSRVSVFGLEHRFIRVLT